MIEDLIEGIACYCDNDYQVNALNNMYSTLYPNQRSFGFFGNLANAIKGKYNEAKKSYYDRHDKDKMIRNLKYERDQAIYDRKIDSDIHANVIKDANDTIGTLYHNDQSDLKGFNKVKNAAKRYKAEAEKNISDFGDGIKVLNGRYGPYITDGKKNAKIPKDVDPKKLSHDEAKKLIDEAPAAKKRFPRRSK
jgi:hypothetical protein